MAHLYFINNGPKNLRLCSYFLHKYKFFTSSAHARLIILVWFIWGCILSPSKTALLHLWGMCHMAMHWILLFFNYSPVNAICMPYGKELCNDLFLNPLPIKIKYYITLLCDQFQRKVQEVPAIIPSLVVR